jgi:hypothetical protein
MPLEPTHEDIMGQSVMIPAVMENCRFHSFPVKFKPS